jgi:Conserved TM helix
VVLADLNIGDSLERGFDVFFSWLPALLAAIAILVIGFIVAKVVGNLIGRALDRAGFDRTLHGGPAGSFVRKVSDSPSGLLGRIAFWVLFLGAVSLAVTALGIDALTDFVAAVFAYLPNVIAALLIFIVAGLVAAAVSTLVTRFMGDTGLGKIVATAAPILVMTIATFMILDQLQIAETIVTITYAALLGAIALGSALAFGLGGRDVAARMLEGAYQKGQENREQFRRDLDLGVQRARSDAESVRESARERVGEGDGRTGSDADTRIRRATYGPRRTASGRPATGPTTETRPDPAA